MRSSRPTAWSSGRSGSTSSRRSILIHRFPDCTDGVGLAFNSEARRTMRQVRESIRTICFLGAICGCHANLLGAQAKPGPRGNVPGEWRVWGADAWSTRYSPLDQINAQNFNSLQIAWQWNAGEFGED